jgi:hypothetical protein
MDPAQSPTIMEFLRQNAFIVGALSGSVAAYLLGLIVTYWRCGRRCEDAGILPV